MIGERNYEIEIKELLSLAEEHEQNGDLHAGKEALRQAQVNSHESVICSLYLCGSKWATK